MRTARFLPNLFCLLLLIAPAAAGAGVFWEEHFAGGIPGAYVPGWVNEYDGVNHVTCTAMVYSGRDSFGCVSMTVREGSEGKGKVLSPPISCDVNVYNTLELKISDLRGQTVTSWSITLVVDKGLENPIEIPLQPGTIGAIGSFTFSLQNLPDFSGNVIFRIRIDTKLAKNDETGVIFPAGYILIHYIRLYAAPEYHSGDFKADGNRKRYVDLWREDFSDGAAGQPMEKWWDDRDEAVMNATIDYVAGGARVKMTVPEDPSKGYKVSGPGVYWDAAAYPLVRIRLLGIAPGTICQIGAMENGAETPGADWRWLKFAQITNTDEWVCDVRNTPEWCWPRKRLIFLQLFVDNAENPGAYSPNAYFDVAYVAISREITPAALTEKTATFATPNPFFPSRSPNTTLHFETPDPTADYTIRIFNMKGRLVRQMENQNLWNGRDDAGRMAEGGVYLYQVERDGKVHSGQITLIR